MGWDEWQHPRDHRGRFSRHGSEQWVKRAADVFKAASSAPQVDTQAPPSGRPRIGRDAKAAKLFAAHQSGVDTGLSRPSKKATASPTSARRAADVKDGDYVRVKGEDQYGKQITMTGYTSGAGAVRIGKRGSKSKRDMVAIQITETKGGQGGNYRGTVYAAPDAPVKHLPGPGATNPAVAKPAAELKFGDRFTFGNLTAQVVSTPEPAETRDGKPGVRVQVKRDDGRTGTVVLENDRPMDLVSERPAPTAPPEGEARRVRTRNLKPGDVVERLSGERWTVTDPVHYSDGRPTMRVETDQGPKYVSSTGTVSVASQSTGNKRSPEVMAAHAARLEAQAAQARSEGRMADAWEADLRAARFRRTANQMSSALTTANATRSPQQPVRQKTARQLMSGK